MKPRGLPLLGARDKAGVTTSDTEGSARETGGEKEGRYTLGEETGASLETLAASMPRNQYPGKAY